MRLPTIALIILFFVTCSGTKDEKTIKDQPVEVREGVIPPIADGFEGGEVKKPSKDDIDYDALVKEARNEVELNEKFNELRDFARIKGVPIDALTMSDIEMIASINNRKVKDYKGLLKEKKKKDKPAYDFLNE